MLIGFDSAKASKGTILAAAATLSSTFSSMFTTADSYVAQ
jgi:hypothetical protein